MLGWLDKVDQLERKLDRILGPTERSNSEEGPSLGDLHLGDFIPALTPRWERPDHLGQLLEVFERIKRGEILRVLLSVPPQHGKTETELHGLAQLLLRDPYRTHAFVSYSADLAWSKSRLARDYALSAGVTLRDDSKALHEWHTREGGGLLATGVGGPLTGQPVSGVLVIDDPFKNRQEAESQLIRDNVRGWFTSTAMTRVHDTTSVVVVHTRWHPDDLIGTLSDERNESGQPIWEYINIPAINDDGEALWPKHRSLKLLNAARARSEYDWHSMYMGSPRARGGSVFQDVYYAEEMPSRCRVAIGLDLAYTAKTYADWSVAVVLGETGGKYFVLDVVRKQADAPTFAGDLRQLAARYPGAPMFSFVGGTEKGVIDLLNRNGLRIHAEPAKQDKFVRAQPVAAAWKAGKVFLPRTAPWVSAFVAELGAFTGVEDRHDDQVDALAGAHAVFVAPTATRDIDSLKRGFGYRDTDALARGFGFG